MEVTTVEAINHNEAKIEIETRTSQEQHVILVSNMILAFLPDSLNLKLEEDGGIVIYDEKERYLGQIATRHIRKDWTS